MKVKRLFFIAAVNLTIEGETQLYRDWSQVTVLKQKALVTALGTWNLGYNECESNKNTADQQRCRNSEQEENRCGQLLQCEIELSNTKYQQKYKNTMIQLHLKIGNKFEVSSQQLFNTCCKICSTCKSDAWTSSKTVVLCKLQNCKNNATLQPGFACKLQFYFSPIQK